MYATVVVRYKSWLTFKKDIIGYKLTIKKINRTQKSRSYISIPISIELYSKVTYISSLQRWKIWPVFHKHRVVFVKVIFGLIVYFDVLTWVDRNNKNKGMYIIKNTTRYYNLMHATLQIRVIQKQNYNIQLQVNHR